MRASNDTRAYPWSDQSPDGTVEFPGVIVAMRITRKSLYQKQPSGC